MATAIDDPIAHAIQKSSERTTVRITNEDLANLRLLAASVGFKLSWPRGNETGNVSMLMARLGRAFRDNPDLISVALARVFDELALGDLAKKYSDPTMPEL